LIPKKLDHKGDGGCGRKGRRRVWKRSTEGQATKGVGPKLPVGKKKLKKGAYAEIGEPRGDEKDRKKAKSEGCCHLKGMGG